jgi:putative membrane protein
MWQEIYSSGLIPFSRANIMFDFVALAMFIVCPVLHYSIGLVKKKKYQLHRNIQIILAGVLLIAVTLFEVDVRVNGWRHLAEQSPYYDSILFPALIIHICFSMAAVLSWIVMIFQARKIFADGIKPNLMSSKHKKLGHIAKNTMYLTSITGWIFYYLAFIA